MQQLTFVHKGLLEWHDLPAPRLEGSRQALAATRPGGGGHR
jgi:hypothetical protein